MAFLTEPTEDSMGIIHVETGVVTGGEILAGCKSHRALVEPTENQNFHYKAVDLSAVTELRIRKRNSARSWRKTGRSQPSGRERLW